METTEKIVEAYVRYVNGWATIPNIKCPGQYEIDLLAVDLRTGTRYHIEVGVSVSGAFSKLTGKPFDEEWLKQRVKQSSQRRTVGYFTERKFSAQPVIDTLGEYGYKNGNYTRVIVSWGWTNEAGQQANDFGILLWDFRDIIRDIADTIASTTRYFTDDTVRTLQLYARAAKKPPSAGQG